MRIALISRSWPPQERSGVSIAALSHARLLIEQGHEVSIIGANNSLQSIQLPLANRTYIPATGSGALYSPVRINHDQLKQAIADNQPDLVIVEAWQTALSDSAIEAAFRLGIPVLMISHGISLNPHKASIQQLVRALAWVPYRFFKLPRLIKQLSAITTLDESSHSPRFFDRDLAKKNNIPMISLKNFPAHQYQKVIPRADRKMQLLVVGYFSVVKNQLGAIHLLSKLPEQISCCFVGDRRGVYFEACQQRVSQLGLENRVSFLQDDECNLAEQIANSVLVFSPSMTEALPMTLIEAMACGTPFVATSVGAVSSFLGGILANTEQFQIEAINILIQYPDLWQQYSDAGSQQAQSEFTEANIAAQLANAVKLAMLKARQSQVEGK